MLRYEACVRRLSLLRRSRKNVSEMWRQKKKVWQEMKLVCTWPQKAFLCHAGRALAYRYWVANEGIKADNLIL